MGDICDNIIGLVLACLPSENTDATASLSRYIMSQPSGSQSLSPVLFMHVGNPYIPPFEIIYARIYKCMM